MAKARRRIRPTPGQASALTCRDRTPVRSTRLDLLAGTALAALVGCGLFTFATPAIAQVSGVRGGTVVAGEATIRNAAPGHVTVTQSTNRGVIDWRSFSIDAGERVDFLQPGTSSVTLNRVTGPDPSVIAGRLTATGQLILVNGAGVVFANGAQINAAGLVASTTNVVDPQRFMQGGRVTFDRPAADANASVVNAGTITVREGGLVGLVGNAAANSGTINARLGHVVIGGAETFTVDLAGDGLINFQLGKPVTRQPLDAQGNKRPLAANTGTINADGGSVTITARAARGVVDSVVNAGGTINARAVRDEGGVVVFGADEGTLNVTGKVDVSGAAPGQRGGQVVARAAQGKVNVAATARIDASGASGGGKVQIGGSKQGQGPVAGARDTKVVSGAVISADATRKGDGGTVIVWADNATVFGGTVSARGGPQGGNGGFVETSGKDTLTILEGASVTAGAPVGAPGLWLLDPTNVTINAAMATSISATLTGGTDVTVDTNPPAGDPDPGKAGDITLEANISALNLSNNVTLTLQAHGKIDLGAKSISLTAVAGKTASIVLDTATLAGTAADHSISGSGKISATNLTLNADITAGSIALAGEVNVTRLNFNSAGAVTIGNTSNSIVSIGATASTAGGDVTIASDIDTAIGAGGIAAGSNAISISTVGSGSTISLSGMLSGGTITLSSANRLVGAGAISATGAVSLKAEGTEPFEGISGINLTGTITATGVTVESAADVTLSSANNAFGIFSTVGTIGGAITVTHKGDLTINTTDAGGNTASFTATDGGNITVAGALTASDGVTLNAAGAVQVQAAVSAEDGDVTISATSVGQTAAGVITAAGLAVTASGDVDLTQAVSDIGVFAVNATGNVGLLEADGFSIGTVGALDGATVGGSLRIDAGGGITQSQPISASALAVRATGLVDLTSGANTIGTFAANVTDASVGLLVDGDLSIGSVVAVGKLATLDGVKTTGTGVVSFKASGKITQTSAISAAGGLAAVTTGGDILLDGATNTTATVAFDASGDVSYKASAMFSIGEVSETGALDAVSGLTTPGNATLTATGATAGIAQTKAIDAATLDINTAGAGNVTLTNASNLIAKVQSTTGLGAGTVQVLDSTGGLDVAAMTAGGPVTITASGGLSVTGSVTTAGKNLTLTSKGGAVTVNAALDVGTATVALKSGGSGNITATAGAITAGVLTLQTGTGGGATVDTAAHNVATVQTAGTGVGSGGLTFKQERSLGLSVGPVVSTGDVSISEAVGPLTIAGKIDTSAGDANVTLTAGAGSLAINGQIDAGNGQIALLAQQAITQAGSGAGITASGLRAENSSGNISLNPTGMLAADVNAVTTIAARAVAGSVLYTSAGTFDVGTVGTTVGITSAGAVSLSVTNAGATITQSDGAAGRISTGTLNIAANGGDVTIDNDTNSIAALGSVNLGSGAFVFMNSAAGPLDVGAIIANGGIDITNKGNLTTSAAITSDGDISLASSTGLIQLGGAVTSNSGGVTLHSSGNLDTGPFAISALNGDVTLVSNAGTVTIGTGGVTVGDTLAIQIGAGLTLTVGGTITAPSVTLVADQMEILAPINAGGTISLAPVTAGRTVTIGTSGAPVGLVIDNAELSNLSSATTLTIGKNAFDVTTAGSIQIGAASIASNTLNLFTTAGIAQDGALSVGAGGVGTLNISAGGTVRLDGFGNQIGTVGGSTTAGDFSILRSAASTSALTVQAITTAGGDIAVRSFDGNVVVVGAQTSNGGSIALGSNNSAGSTLSLNAAINAGTGGVYLFASGGISQTGSGVITATGLAVRNFLTGNISLVADNAAGGNVVLQTAGSSIAFRNTSDFVVGGVPSSLAVAGLNFVIPGPGIMTGAGGTTTLSIGGDVTQAAGAASTIQTGTLTIGRLAGAHPDVTLDNPGNAVSALGVSLGQGAFSFANTGDLTILGAGSAGGGYSVSTAGALTQGSGVAIDTSEATSGGLSDGAISLATTSGFFNLLLNGNLDAGTSGTIALTSGGNVIQSAGTITASAVTATAAGIVSLNSGTNGFGTISGTGTSGFSATTTQALTIGASGISSSAGSVTLTANGGTSDITVNDQISALGTVSLIAGRDILQTAGGGISAASLRAVASAGSVDLSGGTNDVVTIAGSASGDFHYVDGAGALTIGTVAGSVGVISTNGDVTIEATGGTMTVASTVVATSADGDVTLRAAGNLSVAAALTASSSTGRVTLRSLNGSVVENAGGVISAAELLALAETNIDIAQAGNTVGASGFAARADTGFVVFINGGAIELDEVGILSGVSAGGAVVIATTFGNVSQTANGIITAGAGLGLAVPGGSIILDQANLITGNIAVVNTGSGSVTIRNTGNINVGTVGPIATAGTSVPQLNGIAASTAAGKFVSLISDTGTITQSAGTANRIVGGELRATTNSRNVTLANAANEFSEVGNVNLGDGQLTVVDSTGGLILSSPVVADGGVILTTLGAFTLPGSITVANGDISLTSKGSGITLGSTLSAVNGQVQLDAGGTGSIVQSGGTITAGTLIARAPGDVRLVQANNAVGTIAGKSATGVFRYQDKTAVTIGTLVDSTGVTVSGLTTTNQDITVRAGSGIAVNAALNAATGTVRLQTADGNISQTAGASITAAALLANALDGSVVLATAVNSISSIAGSVAGNFEIRTKSDLVVSALAGDSLTTAGTGIDAGGTITLTSTQGSISQAAGAPIVGDRLHATANATGASVTLTAGTNAFASISGSSSGDFSATTSQSLTVASGGVSSAAGSIRLVASGSGSDIAVANDLEASGGTVSLIAGRNVSDTSAGGIVAASLRAVASTGSVDLSHAAAANRVATIAGSAAGDFVYVSNGSDALTVGTVTTAGVTATGGDVTLASGGDLGLAAAVRADAGSGTVSLTSTAGAITSVSADGLVAGNRGVFQAASNVDLARAGNTIGAGGLAGASEGGYFVLFSGTALHVDSVNGVSGIRSKGATILQAGAGNITQAGGAAGRITAGGGLGLVANAGSIVLDQPNAVSGNFFADAAGSLTFRNGGSIRIGELAVSSASGGAIGGNGITASVASGRFISLTSDSGTIGQDGASGSAIVGNELRASTAGRNVALANTRNRLNAVGAADLGAGAFTLFDSAGGLVASGPISANGGVDLTTQGTLSLPGSITVANGDISLTSKGSGITLGSTLSAVNGQVQLDAGGTGSILQTGGSITARTLLVRAPGDVEMTRAGNDTGTIAGWSSAGTFRYRDKTAIAIGSPGVATKANGDITLVAGAGGSSGGIAVNGAVDAGTGTVRLQTARGDITQAAGAPVTATSLLASALDGSVLLGGSTNNITNIAASALASTLELTTAGDLVVTTVSGDSLTTTGTGIVVNNGDITLRSGGAIVLSARVNAANGSAAGGSAAGDITLTAGSGSISQSAAGVLVGDGLLVRASGRVDLDAGGNHVTRLAGRAGSGTFRFRNADALVITAMGGISGVSTSNADIGVHAGGDLTLDLTIDARGPAGTSTATVRLQASGGHITQGADGQIVAGTLLANTVGSGDVVLTNPANFLRHGAAGSPGFVAGRAAGNFRVINGNDLTVTDAAVSGDAGLDIAGATGVRAGAGRLVDLGVSSGDLSIQGPVTANAGMIVYRRLAGAPVGDIIVGGDTGTPGNETGGAWLLIVDLTGSSSVALTGLAESGPGSTGAPGGLFRGPTPPTLVRPSGLGGPNAGGNMVIGALNGIDSTVYLAGGGTSFISSSAPGHFGVLGVYAPEGARVNLQSIVRAIPNSVPWPIGPFGPNAPGPVGTPPDAVARDFVRKGGLPSINQRFNNCVIAGPSCTTIFTQIANPPAAADDAVIGVSGSSLDDSSIVLVNQGNEDFIEEDEEDEEERRNDAGASP